MTKEWLRLYYAASIVLSNANTVPDPAMEGLTDTYSVPLDDIEELGDAVNAIKLAEINKMEDRS